MTDEPNGQPNDRNAARQARLRAALRENLKRRKSQIRRRADQAGGEENDPLETPGQRRSAKDETE